MNNFPGMPPQGGPPKPQGGPSRSRPPAKGANLLTIVLLVVIVVLGALWQFGYLIGGPK